MDFSRGCLPAPASRCGLRRDPPVSWRTESRKARSASGNERRAVAYPARAHEVLSVGATTEHGCLARYSNKGPALDLVAPGGGKDKPIEGDPNCHPTDPKGRDIVQMTFRPSTGQFGMPGGYRGT